MERKKVDVLDKGFVELMMCADSDHTVVNAARVSFGKQVDPDDFLSERDEKLIHYLARENHWSPFAHPQVRFRVKAPIFVRTQLFKSKVGLTENEVSRRYVDDEPEFYEPEVWRGRPDKSIKQGSGKDIECPYAQRDTNFQTLELYHFLIGENVAPEMARMVLPQSTYTEWIWTGSLAAFARVYRQRSDPHAQWEAQQYAHALDKIIAPLFPVSWEALTK